MDPSNLYSYPYPQRQPSPGTSSVRHTSSNQNSSAFSASANPDEDWTQISDLAERRRIQNRIAQRNYRKKLKRRLEDLEKRTVSSSISPERVPRRTSSGATTGRQTMPTRDRLHRSVSQNSPVFPETSLSPEILQSENWPETRHSDGHGFSFALSAPMTYSAGASYPPLTDYFTDSQYSSVGYQQMATSYSNPHCQQVYSQAILPSTPSLMAYNNNIEVHPDITQADMFPPLDITYASLNGTNGPTTHDNKEFEMRTPALTDSMSYLGSSRECSPSFLSRYSVSDSGSLSPNMHILQI